MKSSGLLSPFKGRSAVYFLPIFTFLSALRHPGTLVLLPLVMFIVFRKDRFLFGICLVLFVVLFFRSIEKPDSTDDRVDFTGVVMRVEKERPRPRLMIQGDVGRFYVYDDDLTSLYPGDVLQVSGMVDSPDRPGFFHDFNYQAHLKSMRVDGMIYTADINHIGSGRNPYRLYGALMKYIDENLDGGAPYVKALLFADRSGLDDIFYTEVQTLGIAHLFAVSGLHVAILFLLMFKTIRLVVPHDLVSELMTLTFLVFYLFLTGAPPSVLRATIMAVLLFLNRRLRLGFKPVDLLVWLMIVSLIINPAYFDHAGFLMSFTISFALLMSQFLFSGKTKGIQLLSVSLIAFAFGLPFTTDMQQHINPVSVIYNVGYVLFLTFVLLPATYVVFLLPILEPVIVPIYTAFEASVHFLATHGSYPVPFHLLPGIQTICYFLMLFWLMATDDSRIRRFRITILVLVLLLVFFKPSLKFYGRMSMFDVHGDAFLLEDRFDRCNLLIDTGEEDPHNKLVRALSARHIRQLDLVLISHRHFDHYGAYDDLNAAIDIKKTITNHNQMPYEGMWRSCGGIEYFIFPSKQEFSDENNSSMVVKIRFENLRILFTGDIESERERLFVTNYQPEIDILKVAHHGSATSTTDVFLSHIHPEEAWIPAHRNNRFGFPSPLVLSRLEERHIKVIRLDETGTVSTIHFLNRRFKKTAYGG